MDGRNFSKHNFKDRSIDEKEREWKKLLKEKLGEDYIKKILNFNELKSEDLKDFILKLKDYVKEKEINTTKLRKIYDIIKRADNEEKLILSLPTLAYLVGKEQDNVLNKIGDIVLLLTECIYGIENKNHFRNIQKFTETLIAYHKYFHA